MSEVNIQAKQAGGKYTSSLALLVFVIMFTVGLHFYNNFMQIEIEKIKTNISAIDVNISEVEKDKKLQIFTLLELNKQAISSYENMNKITKYINHMNVIKGKYDVEFTGFNLSKGQISTNVNATSDDEGIAYLKVKEFINKYRQDPKALFDIEFINSFEGMDDMKFKVSFKIK